MPTLPDETVSDTAPVELIERGPFEIADSVTTQEPMEHRPVVGTKALAAVSIGLIVLAFALMTRPGPEDRVVEEAPQTTLPPTTTTPPPVADTETEDGPVYRPVPPFAPNLPAELPGVISGFDERGWLIHIDRSGRGPVETPLDLQLTDDRPAGQLAIAGGELIDLDADVLVRGELLVVEDDDTIVADTFNLSRIVPRPDDESADGADGADGERAGEPPGVLLVDLDPSSPTAAWVPIDSGDTSDDRLEWVLPGPSVEVVGVWGDELILERANQIWRLARNGSTSPVGDGQLLAFDGRYVARLVCDGVGVCSLAVGPPDDPNARTLDLPEWLERGPDALWTPTVAISPDGTRLAMAGPNGGISSPLIVDLETGVTTPLADGINRQAAMAWSPDGRWLAYVYTDDVMVWSLDQGRSWRVTVNRELQNLLWR